VLTKGKERQKLCELSNKQTTEY